MRWKTFLGGMIIVTLLLLPSMDASVYPNNFTVHTSEGSSFNVDFTIFNEMNSTVFYDVVLPSAGGWKISVNAQNGLIKPHNAQTVKVEFQVPKIVSKNKWDFSIRIDEYSEHGYLKGNWVNLTVYVSTTGFYSFNLPFPNEWGYWKRFLNSLIFWAVITGAAFVIFYILRKTVKLTKTKVDDILLRILQNPVTLWIISYGLMVSFLQFPLSANIVSVIYLLYQFVAITIVTWIIYKIFRELIINYALHYTERKRKMERSIISALDKLGIVTIVTIYGIMLLGLFGIDITVLLASVGILGIILGFAAQDTLGNFFSGIHILLDKSIQVGDYIILENDEKVYRVLDVGLRSTKLYDIFSHTVVFIPNNIIANHKIINLSRPDQQIKLRINVGVSYKSNVNKVKDALLNTIYKNKYILKDEKHKPQVIFHEFGESSLNFILYVWVDKLTDQWIVASQLRQEILDTFRKEGIEIPYPQVDIHIKKD